MNISAQELNQAIGEYITTFPNESRLSAYLAGKYSEQLQAEIRTELSAAIRTTDDLLWSQSPGVAWSSAFEQQLFAHVKSKHSWLNQKGFASLLGYSKWLCWHEGLNA